MENPDLGIFRKVLRPGRHPIGFPELVGSILYEYEPERSHMDLVRIFFLLGLVSQHGSPRGALATEVLIKGMQIA